MLKRCWQRTVEWGTHKQVRTIAGVTAFAGLISILVASCCTESALVVAPAIPGAEFVGNDTCAGCHEKQVKNFARGPHARIHVANAKLAGSSGCESCHGPGSKHAEAGGGKGVFIINPGKSPDTCFSCHTEKKAQFRLPYHHAVLEGRMSCTDCHDLHGDDAMKPAILAMVRTNDVCARCHKEQTQKFAYEHRALREGCSVCHQVHGSINKKMLKYSDAHICLQCHTSPPVSGSRADAYNNQGGAMAPERDLDSSAGVLMVPNRGHAGDLARGGVCWSCHDSVHGSNTSPTFRY